MGVHTGKAFQGFCWSSEEWLAGKQGLHSAFPSSLLTHSKNTQHYLAIQIVSGKDSLQLGNRSEAK